MQPGRRREPCQFSLRNRENCHGPMCVTPTQQHLHSTVQYTTTLHYTTLQYNSAQYSTVQHSTVQYSAVQ